MHGRRRAFGVLGSSPALSHPVREIGQRRLTLVGGSQGTNVAASLLRSARDMNLDAELLDIADAFAGPKALRTLAWRFLGRRPLRLSAFGAKVVDHCLAIKADWLLATGLAPLRRDDIRRLATGPTKRIVFVTDDPWNPAHRSAWFMDAVVEYDVVYTPRRANLDDFRRLGCRDVRYLPFGFDPELAHPPSAGELKAHALDVDVLFVGGGDRDRIPMLERVASAGVSVAVYGAEWPTHGSLGASSLGYANPAMLRAATATAKINLCLVRRANRDGHVMRSFEAGAIGGCLLVEWTTEHEEIFGPDDECVVYFRTDQDLQRTIGQLLADEPKRRRLAAAVRRRIVDGAHSYGARLERMLEL